MLQAQINDPPTSFIQEKLLVYTIQKGILDILTLLNQ